MAMHPRILLSLDVSTADATEVIAAAEAPPARFGTVLRGASSGAVVCTAVGLVGFLFPQGNPARNLLALLVLAFVLIMVAVGAGILRLLLAQGRRARTAEQDALLRQHEGMYVDVFRLPWDNRTVLLRAMGRVRERFGDDPPPAVFGPLWKAAKASREAHAVILEHRGNVLGDPQTLERTWREAGDGFRELARRLSCDPSDFLWMYAEGGTPDLAWCAGPVHLHGVQSESRYRTADG